MDGNVVVKSNNINLFNFKQS